jgi:hypothetical protein
MPATVTPTSYLAGCKAVTSNSDGSADPGDFANSTEYFCIPLATLTGAVSDDIRPSLGDIRKIMLALETAVYDAYQAIATADRPTKWLNNRSSSVSDSADVITRNFNNQFFTEVSGEEVAAE